ncbi:MAG: aminoacyl-histidine dipeptidase [Bacteroidales bacterium]|nr:aminoacyl-histidine dipeptidase [Bacteroidales bacterium]MCB8998851.1 aminoacyl-histidine dipeptidase [Bacteroidales bacterium]MCB9014010.1 aminoacyl-histidine dipeptidase [Bacteroidales bacterium]
MDSISHLEPKLLWTYFDQICQVPRPSKQEDQIRAFLIDFAKKNKLEYKTDKVGNILIKKPASPGMENRKTLILQSHMDMVCEKNSDVQHNFEKDPIQAYIDGNWIKAKGTTLGADDGIGVAAQMAVLTDNSLVHGPVECLFTVDEETGLTGAFALEKGFFEGDILLNLDSEDEGEIFIGCAGGNDSIAVFEYTPKKLPLKHIAFEIFVKGLRGGHSGDDIQKGLGNANKIVNRFLWNITRKFDARLALFDGGNLRNAIPREARAIFTIHSDDYESCKLYFDRFCTAVKEEIHISEPNLEILLRSSDQPDLVINKKTQARLLNALYACPHGVIEWSRDIIGLVETSTNLASVKFVENNQIKVTTSQRSSLETAREDISDRVQAIFETAKANVTRTAGYPGWKPNTNSAILAITTSSYSKLFGAKPVVRAIHAGLECGLFLEKYPMLDMVSFGPTIRGAHSPDERLDIESTQKFWKLLLSVMENAPVKN